MKDITLITYLECLHKMAPPSGIVHIGAGAGIGITHYWRNWTIPCVVLIDAETSRYEWLKKAGIIPSSYIFSAIVSSQESESILYSATNPAESGLVPIEKLNRIWPNLETTETRDVKTTCLSTLLDQLPQEFANKLNWLVIDCFPALSLLKGATDKYLDQISILLLRVILDDTKVDQNLSEAKLSVIAPFLNQKGYRLIVAEESNHPAVGLALFCKDWRAWQEPQLTAFNDRNSVLSQTKTDLENQIAELNDEREQLHQTQHQLQQQLNEAQAQNQAKEEAYVALQPQLDQLGEYNSTISAAKVELENQIAELNDEREQLHQTQHQLQQQLCEAQAQNQAKEEACLTLQAQLEQLNEQTNQLSAAKTDLENQVIALNDEREQLQQQLDENQAQNQYQENHQIDLSNTLSEIEKLSQERLQRIQDAEQIIKDKDQRIMQLDAEVKETAMRQQMLNDEMLKAESQLELLKDVLLHDPRL